MATTVRITETYDMKTTVGKLGIVGIHTPTNTLVKKLYPGLMKNHKFMRFVKCDVVGACASVLPADPLQVGVTAGEIAPEDMFNPILYTAVTNESFDTLTSRINALSDVGSLGSVGVGNVIADSVSADNNFNVYYSLLAENGKWRKAMPQSGFSIKGLVPLCHEVISTFGNVGTIGNNVGLSEDGETPIYVPDMDVPTTDANWSGNTKTAEVFYRGRTLKMPKFSIHVGREALDAVPNPNIPKTNVLALILPPAKLHEFFYRMRVSWTIRFEGVCSTLEAGNLPTMLDIGGNAHGSNYTFSSSKNELEVHEDMVDVSDVDINKVMES